MKFEIGQKVLVKSIPPQRGLRYPQYEGGGVIDKVVGQDGIYTYRLDRPTRRGNYWHREEMLAHSYATELWVPVPHPDAASGCRATCGAPL